jgi:tetratricopeptide (TPR) repeat protein
MRRVPGFPVVAATFLPFLILFAVVSPAQVVKKVPSVGSAADVQRALALAETGHCAEAMPILKRSIRQITDSGLKKKVGLTGIHCAMTHETPYESLPFLEVLTHDFPQDPEVLYSASHAYSDLSMHAAQDLARYAPFSYQIHAFNAEALESQGKWDEAVVEYRKILEINPMLVGIHARLGRALLSKPNPSPEAVQDAKKNFEQELQIDPRNAGAEYVLGQLAANENDWAAAATHFDKATKLDANFPEAYLGFGSALVSAKRFSEAIPPLEKYEKLAPDSPTGHYQLALAYAGVGRKDDANREAALQREAAENLESVKRRVADGLLQQQAAHQPEQPSSSESPK